MVCYYTNSTETYYKTYEFPPNSFILKVLHKIWVHLLTVHVGKNVITKIFTVTIRYLYSKGIPFIQGILLFSRYVGRICKRKKNICKKKITTT